MLHNIAEMLTQYFVKSGTIMKEDQEVYSYGFEVGISLFVNIITSVILFTIFGIMFEGILFFIIFFPLRSNAGGIHMKTHFGCFLVSIFTIFTILFLTVNTDIKEVWIIIITIISSIIIWFCAPVEDLNKPLDKIEIKVYGKRARSILAIEIMAVFMCLIFGITKIAYLISLILMLMSIALIMGIVNNKLVKI